MIIYLYGPDSLRRGRKLRELVAVYRSQRKDVDFFEADFEKEPEGWKAAVSFLKQPSIFENRKFLAVREGCSADASEWVSALKKHRAAENTLIILSNQKKPPAAFLFLLKVPVRIQPFEELSGLRLGAFVRREAERLGVRFEPGAARFFTDELAAFPGGRSWICVRVLEQLALQRASSPVSRAHARSLLRSFPREKVFLAACRMLHESDAGRRLGFLEALLMRGDVSAAHVFNSLALQVKQKDLLDLGRYDVSVKSGGLEYEEALTDFVLSR